MVPLIWLMTTLGILACVGVEGRVSVRPVSIQISKPISVTEAEVVRGHKVGTKLGLLVSLHGKHIVAIDSAASNKLTTFTDSKGNDLTRRENVKPAQIAAPRGFGVSCNTEKRGESCFVEISAAGLPAQERLASN